MNEQEIERCLERFTMGKATDVMNFDYAGTLAYIRRLKAEKAALRERLSKAVGLPLVQTIRGNKLPYEVVYKDGNGRIIVTKYRRWQKKQAEARLKELQGGAR